MKKYLKVIGVVLGVAGGVVGANYATAADQVQVLANSPGECHWRFNYNQFRWVWWCPSSCTNPSGCQGG